MKIAFDQATLANDWGIRIYEKTGQLANPQFMDRSLALDAQPTLVTSANAGIPALFTTYIDPKLIEVLVSPMKAAVAYGETKYGDWVTDTAMFEVVESTGEVSSYGDYNNNGSSNANLNYPQRQSYHYQTFTQWGERELERQAKAKVDWAARINIASVLVLNKYQNQTYLFGVAGLQNYGGVNEPSLPAPIAVTGAWSGEDSATIYGDVLRLVAQSVAQSNGILDADTAYTMILSPGNALNLNKTNQFNVNVYTQIKTNFPNIKIVTVPEFATAGSGNVELVQLVADEVEGQKTATCAFTEKMRAHAMITESSSWKQKKSQGSWGFVLFRPVFISQMIG
jgi:hypothetical protein